MGTDAATAPERLRSPIKKRTPKSTFDFQLCKNSRSMVAQKVFGIWIEIALDWNKLTGYSIPKVTMPKRGILYFVSANLYCYSSIVLSPILQPRNNLTGARCRFEDTVHPVHFPNDSIIKKPWLQITMPLPFYQGKRLYLRDEEANWTTS